MNDYNNPPCVTLYDRLISPERSEFLPGTRLAESLLEIPTPRMRFTFLFYETEFVLFLAGLENSVLPMGRDSLHATLNVTSEF